MPQSRKYAILFEKKALSKIKKTQGFKDLKKDEQKALVDTLWKALNNRADEVYEILNKNEDVAKPKLKKLKGKGVALSGSAPRLGMTQKMTLMKPKEKEEEFKLPPSQIPKNIRRGLDALSIYSGVGTAIGLGAKVLPFLFL